MKKLQDMTLEELWKLFPIVLKEHNPQYAHWYKTESAELQQILKNDIVCRISHIGSTAVEGLLAKPIIDILLELKEGYFEDALAKRLEGNGWILMAKDAHGSLHFNKGYTPAGFAERVFHLHIRPLGNWDELYFRDYLRKYPKVAQAYAMLKKDLLALYQWNRDAYTEAKTEFIYKTTALAKREFAGRYQPETNSKAQSEQ